MTFKEIQDDCLDRLGYDSTTTTTVPRTRVMRMINHWHRKILSDTRYSKLRDSKITFATVASQVLYGVAPSVETIKRIYDAATNNPELELRPPEWLRRDSRADLDSGTPYVYVNHGRRSIYRFPASTGIWVASSSASDTTQTVRMETIRSGGYTHAAGPATVNGTTRVQVGTRTDYVDVVKLYLSAVCVGDLAIYDAAASGNQIGIIPIGQTSNFGWLIQLYPLASSVITYTIDCQLRIQDMVQNLDIPMLPEDYHQLLVVAGIYQEMRDIKKQLSQSDRILKQEIEPAMAELLSFIVNTDDYLVVPRDGRRSTVPGSNLGSWYPAGRW